MSSIRFFQEQWPKTKPPKSVSLPLERYTKKQDKELATINKEIDFIRSELKEFDTKLRQAARQNDGSLSACGNCHLKMGQEKKGQETLPLHYDSDDDDNTPLADCELVEVVCYPRKDYLRSNFYPLFFNKNHKS